MAAVAPPHVDVAAARPVDGRVMRAHEAAPGLLGGRPGSDEQIKGSAASVPAEMVEAINAAHAGALEHARCAVERAIRAGELLLQAKDQLQHGRWLPWLKLNCPDISERSAQGYMRLARHCLENFTRADYLKTMTLKRALVELAAAPSNPQPVADLACEVTTGSVTIGAIEHPHTGSQLVFILQESHKYPGYWHIINFRDGDCTVRPVAADGINTALRFYPAASLCTWSMHPDCDVSLVGEVRR